MNNMYIWGGHPKNRVIALPSLPEAWLAEEVWQENDNWLNTYPWNSVEDVLYDELNIWPYDLEWFPIESVEELRRLLEGEIEALQEEINVRKVLLEGVK